LGGLGSRSRKGWGLLEGDLKAGSSPVLLEHARACWAAFRQDLLQDGQPLSEHALPPFPQLAFRRIWKDERTFDRWEKALGSQGMRYRKLKDRDHGGWITGSADPRRSSSLLISMGRERDGKLRGLLCLLPCWKDQDNNGWETLEPFLDDFGKL
jgi:hypothetical protein